MGGGGWRGRGVAGELTEKSLKYKKGINILKKYPTLEKFGGGGNCGRRKGVRWGSRGGTWGGAIKKKSI